MRRTEIAQPRRLLGGDALEQRLGQSRLSDARFGRKHHDTAFTALGLGPPPQQQIELFLAADQWRLGGAKGGKPAFDAALADDAPGTWLAGEALQHLRSEILKLEQRAELASGAVRDDHRVWRGQGLQPCR